MSKPVPSLSRRAAYPRARGRGDQPSRAAWAWLSTLQAYAADCRTISPLPAFAELSPLNRAQSLLIGESLAETMKVGAPWALLVFTSSVPGLAAAAERLDDVPRRCVCLLAEEFERLDPTVPPCEHDPPYVHVWSDFRPANHALAPNGQPRHWCHTSGHYAGPLAAGGWGRRYEWNGESLTQSRCRDDSWIS